MKISRCRYWRCAECDEVHTKKHLADLLRRRPQQDDDDLRGNLRCSRCGARHSRLEVYAGDHDAPDEPEELTEDEPRRGAGQEITTEPAPRRKRPQPEGLARVEVVPEEDEDQEASGERRRRRGRRRRELGQVNVGLAIHYGGMCAFLLGQAAGWLAVVLFVMGVVTLAAARREQDANVGPLLASFFLFLASWGLTSCASIADVVASAFCLRVPDATARGFLLASLIVRLLVLPAGIVLVVLGFGSAAGLTTSALTVVGWVLWVLFLRGLSLCLEQPDLGQEAVSITISAVKLVVGWFVALVCLAFLLALIIALARAGGCFVFTIIFALASGFAGILRYLLVSGKVESPLTLVLYPTGIPIIMRYLDLIGTLRMIILRRS